MVDSLLNLFIFISSLILLVHPGIGLIEVLADDDAKSAIICFFFIDLFHTIVVLAIYMPNFKYRLKWILDWLIGY